MSDEYLEAMSFDISSEIPEAENYEYVGELPPARKYVEGNLARMYMFATQHGVPMLKVIYRATETEFEGYTAWDNVTLSSESAFKWQPLCKILGVDPETLATKTMIDPTIETNAGNPVVRVGDVIPEDIPVRFAVKYRKSKFSHATLTDVIAVVPQ